MKVSQAVKSAIRARVKGTVAFDEPMSAHTWFQVGGAADVYAAPESPDELIKLVQWLAAEDVPYLIIGGGSNLLVKDKGIRGVVIDTAGGLKGVSVAAQGTVSTVIRAMSGEKLFRVCRFAIEKGLAGLNFAVGIPGTVGGAIIMNAGTAEGAIDQVLIQATVLYHDGRLETLTHTGLLFEYRGISIPEMSDPRHPAVIIDGSFKLSPSSREDLAAEADVLLKSRKNRQPKEGASAGCFFKNPEGVAPAGALIEKSGMKGVQVGGAEVSEKHANFILNRSKASAEDILRLMEKVQAAVYKNFQVHLQPEVRIVGE